MRGLCKDCWSWRYAQEDDGGTRYGQCQKAYAGADEAYPWSYMLIALDGPEHCRKLISPRLLTAEIHGCKEFEEG